jgi:uncharacterized membrane protein HdeD (DUF308 family)
MSAHVAPSRREASSAAGLREAARELTGRWWVLLVAGTAWLAAALVILQFDRASVTTVGLIVGVLFLVAAVESFLFARLPVGSRWAPALFGVLYSVAAVISFAGPAQTVAGIADVLGFLFLLVGIAWMVRSFLERPLNPLWWLNLIGGILMTAMAFWTAGQFYLQRVYVLLVFAGIWALMEGITTISRAFALRRVHDDLSGVQPDAVV